MSDKNKLEACMYSILNMSQNNIFFKLVHLLMHLSETTPVTLLIATNYFLSLDFLHFEG